MAYADIVRCAAFLRTRIPPGEPPPPDLHQTSQAVGKSWRHSESSDTKNLPPSLWSVKETTNPLGSLFKLFEGVLFFLSIYLIEIRLNPIRNRDDAQTARSQ